RPKRDRRRLRCRRGQRYTLGTRRLLQPRGSVGLHWPSDELSAAERRSSEQAPQGEAMLVVMQAHASEEQVRAVCEKIEKLGYRAHAMPGAQRTLIGITGHRTYVEQGTLEEMPGVQDGIKVKKPDNLVSRDIKEDSTLIRFPGTAATIGGAGLAVVAGPCAIESREQ